MDAHGTEHPRPRNTIIRRKPLLHLDSNGSTSEPLLLPTENNAHVERPTLPHLASNESIAEPLLVADNDVHVERAHAAKSATLYSRAADSFLSTSDGDTDRCTHKDDARDGDSAVNTTKNPFWVRKSTLALFVVCFAAMIAGLLSLYFLDQSWNGFRPILGTNQFLWSYAPTAILVVIVSFWRQVDYHCKILQPWWELYKGPVPADRSLMLDYLSPIHPTSLAKAIKYRHFPVVASISGFVILKAVVLASTGLLLVSPTHLVDDLPIIFSNEFNGSEFLSSVLPWQYDTFSGERPAYRNLSGTSLKAYYGVLSGELDSPNDIVDLSVVQSFELLPDVDASAISTSEAEADVFVPGMSCEIAQPTVLDDPYVEGLYPYFSLRSETCHIRYNHHNAIFTALEGAWECAVEPCATPNPVYAILRANCSEVWSGPGISNQGYSEHDPSATAWSIARGHDLRFALITGNITSKDDGSQYLQLHYEAAAAVICKFDYAIEKRIVTLDLSSRRHELGALTSTRKLDNLTDVELGELVYAEAFTALDMLQHEGPLSGRLNRDNAARPLFAMMLQTLEGERSLQRLMSSETLLEAAERALSGTAAHLIRQSCLRPSRTPASSSVTWIDQRLHVNVTSLVIMVAGFVLAFFCAVCIFLTAPLLPLPWLPDSNTTRAMVLRSSTALQHTLRRTGSLRTSQLQASLLGYNFSILNRPHFAIQVSISENKTGGHDSIPLPKSRFWIPFAVSYFMAVLTFVAPLACIFTIEVLHRLSQAQDGFISVSANENRASLLSRYGAALIMLLIATCYNGFDFVVASFAPFSLLRRGGGTPTRSLKFQVLGNMPPVAIVKSLRARHFASALSSLAGITGSVLTIVASGLFFVDRGIVLDSPITVSSNNWWNISWQDSAVTSDDGAGYALNRAQHGWGSVPPSIWNDIVIPDAGNVDFHQRGTGMASTNYTLTLDVLRPELSCDLIANEAIAIERVVDPSDTGKENYAVHLTPSLPPGCRRGGLYGNETFLRFSSLTYACKSEVCWVGQFLDVHLGPWPDTIPFSDDTYYITAGENFYADQELLPDNPAGCPSIAVIFTKVVETGPSHDDVTALLCSQKLQNLTVDVAYTAGSTKPEVTTDISSIPIQYLNNGTDGIETFPWRVQAHMEYNLTPLNASYRSSDHPRFVDSMEEYNHTQFNAFSESGYSSGVRFFDHLLHGPNGTAPEDLSGPSNVDTLIRAVQRLYNKYMSLIIDIKFRQALSPEDIAAEQDNIVHGTMHVHTSRLKVDPTSKLALQIMLGVMTLFGLTAFWLTDLRGTLPRNPCSIASTMGFLAGSDLCDGPTPLIPEDALTMSKSAQDELFNGWMFSLGWWPCNKAARHEEDSAEPLLLSKEDSSNRFGIDVGVPLQLGFRETKWWKLRRRMGRG